MGNNTRRLSFKMTKAEQKKLEKQKQEELKRIKEEKQILEEQVRTLSDEQKVAVHDFHGKRTRIGVVSDTHFGSLCDMPKLTQAVYRLFKREGIHHVYHAGDMVDGNKMFKGHEFELREHGLDEQLKHVVEDYPCFPGMKTYFITGSHDLSFHKQVGIDIGDLIARERKDMVYLGREEKDVILGDHARMRLSHPGGGTAYALSYKTQKYIESLSGGNKPNILLTGHFHKAEYMPCYRNVFSIQTGCLERQTPFMRRHNLAAHIGAWILDFRVNNNGVSSMNAEFYPYYEK